MYFTLGVEVTGTDPKVLIKEISELKDKLQQAEAKIQEQVRSACCHKMREHQQELNNLKKKHEAETHRLNIKYEFEMDLGERKLKQAQKELQEEKHLRFQVEYEKMEGMEIAQTFHHKLKKTEMSTRRSANHETPCEIAKLQKMLRKERKLRVLAETENIKQFRALEALSEEMDQEIKREQDLRSNAESGKQNAEEIAHTLLQKLKDMEKTLKETSAATKLDDRDIITPDIQQLEEMLQGQKKVGLQAGTENLMQLQTVEAVRAEMDQELKKKQELRAQTEAEKQEAVKIADPSPGTGRNWENIQGALS
ncbi:hypothetical protein XENOCAPTIV_027803 [Xenoophorus captivus]|uniref:Uncharacterized protein n=1 Tax=Xenoophorus captivus TaxID=1517983 RepID=A0ABV0SBT8_9TELE